jgi:hypothetical protein
MRRCLLAIHDIYSKRQKKLRGEVLDVYTYDEIPTSLRVQIIHIWYESIGNFPHQDIAWEAVHRSETYGDIVRKLRREYGLFVLSRRKLISEI